MARYVLRLGWLVLACLLASCGGGGGGDDGGGSDRPRMNISPTSFTFTATQGGAAPAAQEASVSVSGGFVAVGIESNSASSFVTASFTITGEATGKITLTPLSPSFVAPGTHTGVVVVRGCLDQFCSEGDAEGSPVSINVSYTVQPQTGLRASPQSLSFTQLQGATAPAAQTLGLSDTTGATYAWNASIVNPSVNGWLKINGAATASGSSLPASLSVSVTASSTPGTLSATVRFTGNGSALDVPVTYTVNEPTLTRSPAQITFSAAASGALPSTQTVTLSTQNSLPVDYKTSVTYGAGATGWLAVPATGTAPGNVTVGVNTTGLAVGTYTATLTFTTATQMVSVSVTYTVLSASITFTPGSASFAIGPSSNATALSQTIAVGSTGASFSWTATSNQPWVTVPPSGSTGSNVTLTIDPAQLDTLDPGLHSATITFSYTRPGGGATSTPLSVSLNLTLPKISWVSPYVALSGSSNQVIVRGKGFNNAGGADLDFGGTSVPAASYTVVSDTEIRVTHPSFTAGAARRIKFGNSLGNPSVVRSTAELVVVDAPNFGPAQSVAYPDPARTVQRIAYDAERRALLIAVTFPGDIGAVYRYTFDGLVWSLSNQAPAVGGLQDFALGPDGKKLFLTSGRTSVTPYDPVTLTAGMPANVSLFSLNFVKQIVMANDGNAVVTTGINGSGFVGAFRYSVADATFTAFQSQCCFLPQAAGSANGSRIVVVNTGISPPMSTFQYDASSGTLGATTLITGEANPAPALDRNATRILIGGRTVYDPNYQALGTIPFAPADHALSPDSTKAYAYESIFANPQIPVPTSGIVRVYNLSATPVGGVFPQIASAPTPTIPGLGNGTRMTISPDGGTLFIAGELGIVVMPAPQ